MNRTAHLLPRLVIAIILLVGALSMVAAQDLPAYTDYFGSVYIDGVPAPTGTIITAIGPEGQECGSFIVDRKGVFGFLSCRAYDPADPLVRISDGALIQFRIGERPAISVGDTSWAPSAQRRIKLVTQEGQILPSDQPHQEVPSSTSVGWFELALALLALSFVVGISVFFMRRGRKKKG